MTELGIRRAHEAGHRVIPQSFCGLFGLIRRAAAGLHLESERWLVRRSDSAGETEDTQDFLQHDPSVMNNAKIGLKFPGRGRLSSMMSGHQQSPRHVVPPNVRVAISRHGGASRRTTGLWCFAALLLILLTVTSRTAAECLRYEIAVELDPDRHTLFGSQTIRWTNSTDEVADELWFHLYLNAFANNRTTFMRGLDGASRIAVGLSEEDRGWIRIFSMATQRGDDLLSGLTFERPDDGNLDDLTVARVPLPEAVEPGEAVEVELQFEARLPRLVARTGWSGQYHLVGQWFPKLGVYERSDPEASIPARWNCHQFHETSEFFADFASYRVQVTVPESFVLGATGVEVERRNVAEGSARKTVATFTAEQVHDFAWCAAPASLMEVVEAGFEPARDVPLGWLERAMTLLDLSAADLELPPVHLRILRPVTQAGLTDRMLRGVRLGMAWYGLFYGPYPYPQLTVVMPPPGAEASGGMEYPTFITSLSSRLLQYPPLAWFPLSETVTIHELGHQYFQGLLASNEFEQAWLDEGLNTYAELSCLRAIEEDDLIPETLVNSNWRGERLRWALRSALLTIDRKAWEYRTRGDYGVASYTKTALVMRTLEGLLGPEVFAQAMRRYALEFRFRHPTGEDLEQVLSDTASEDLGWFFDQALRSDATVDWAVEKVRQNSRGDPRGLRWNGGEWVSWGDEMTVDSDAPDHKSWNMSVDVVRKGQFAGPLQVLLIFADGRREEQTWDGAARWKRFELESPARLEAVVLDPEGVWALEDVRHNNYWRDPESAGLGRSRVWWVYPLLRSLAAVPTPWS